METLSRLEIRALVLTELNAVLEADTFADARKKLDARRRELQAEMAEERGDHAGADVMRRLNPEF